MGHYYKNGKIMNCYSGGLVYQLIILVLSIQYIKAGKLITIIQDEVVGFFL